MSVSWDAITPEGRALAEPLTGPPLVLSGSGCRLVLKTTENDKGRNDNLLVRLHKATLILSDANAVGISKEPQEGYVRVYGGEPALYVKGDDERGIYTTLGQAVLASIPDVRKQIDKLEIRALVEW